MNYTEGQTKDRDPSERLPNGEPQVQNNPEDEWTGKLAAHPGLVDRETFERVQTKPGERRDRTTYDPKWTSQGGQIRRGMGRRSSCIQFFLSWVSAPRRDGSSCGKRSVLVLCKPQRCRETRHSPASPPPATLT